MVISRLIAGVSGAAIRIFLTALEDPAQSSSIVLTTVAHFVDYFSFSGLATRFSRLLVAG